MNRMNAGFHVSGCLLIGALVLMPQGGDRQTSALAACAPSADCNAKASNPSCKQADWTPFNLDTDTRTPHKVQLSWEVCQKSEFYQVTWSQFGGAETLTNVEAPTLNWTLTRVRDEAKLTFKVRGCNHRSNAEPNCSGWTTLTMKTPDWD